MHKTLSGKVLSVPELVRQRYPDATAWESKLAERATGVPSPSPFWFIYPSKVERGMHMLTIGAGPTEEAAWLDAWKHTEQAILDEERAKTENTEGYD